MTFSLYLSKLKHNKTINLSVCLSVCLVHLYVCFMCLSVVWLSLDIFGYFLHSTLLFPVVHLFHLTPCSFVCQMHLNSDPAPVPFQDTFPICSKLVASCILIDLMACCCWFQIFAWAPRTYLMDLAELLPYLIKPNTALEVCLVESS